KISIAITNGQLRRCSGSMGIILVEDIQWDLRVGNLFQPTKHTHLRVNNGVSSPIQILADVHFDPTFLDEFNDKRITIKGGNFYAVLITGDRNSRYDEL